MTTTLQQALASHAQQLGANYDNLGKAHRTYLRYDKSVGWSVVKFEGVWGFVQQILRYLGFYASTRIEWVASHLRQELHVPPALLARINACRDRHVVVRQEVRFGYLIGPHQCTLSFVQGDILNPGTETIVNPANEACLGGGGVDGLIHQAAGAGLRAECLQLRETSPGVRCATGSAVITGSHQLEGNGISRIIHAVGPRYDGSSMDTKARAQRDLAATYEAILQLAYRNGIRTIAIPAISTGIYGYPFEEATRIAALTVRDFVNLHPEHFGEIKLMFVRGPFERARAAVALLDLGMPDDANR